MQLAKKEILGAWNMLPLNVPKFEYANQNEVKCKLLVLVLFPFIVLNFRIPKCYLLTRNVKCEGLQAKW
jgi:hypothetical protein